MSYPTTVFTLAFYAFPARVAMDGGRRGWVLPGIIPPNGPPLIPSAPGRPSLAGLAIPVRWGKSRGFVGSIFPPVPPPIIRELSRASGPGDVPTALTIFGANFVDVTGVTVGGVSLTSIVVVNPNTITGITGAHAPGVVDVVVTTTHGSFTLVGGYTYT